MTSNVGKLCPETDSFVISGAPVEVEFEVEENEVSLNLSKDVTAEAAWGIFIPVAGAAAGEAAAKEGAGAEAEARVVEQAKLAKAETENAEAVAAESAAQKGALAQLHEAWRRSKIPRFSSPLCLVEGG